MALPSKNSSLLKLSKYSLHVQTTLMFEDQTKDLAAGVIAKRTSLQSHIKLLEPLEEQKIIAFAKVSWQDRSIDNCVRDLSADAKSADRKNLGLQAHSKLFTDGGFSGLVRPSGRMLKGEIEEIKKISLVLEKLSTSVPSFKENIKALAESMQSGEQALQELENAEQKIEEYQKQKLLFRSEWFEEMYRLEAELLKRFPGQKSFVKNFFSPS